jgi:hypothetical protein
MIVNITVATAGLDAGAPGVGAAAPQVGISPANAEVDKTQVKASVARNRFMVCFSYLLRVKDDAKISTSQ